jgi:hypothetical protein
MKYRVTIVTLKKKNYTGIKAFFRKIKKKPLSIWIVLFKGRELILVWDKKNKIDDSFDGKEIGIDSRDIKSKYATPITFYPDNFKSMYPDLID